MDEFKVNGLVLPEPLFRGTVPIPFPFQEGTAMGALLVSVYRGKGKVTTVDESGQLVEKDARHNVVILSQGQLPQPDETGRGLPIDMFYREFLDTEDDKPGMIFKLYGVDAQVIVALDDGERKYWEEFAFNREVREPVVRTLLNGVDMADDFNVRAKAAGLDPTDPLVQEALSRIKNGLIVTALKPIAAANKVPLKDVLAQLTQHDIDALLAKAKDNVEDHFWETMFNHVREELDAGSKPSVVFLGPKSKEISDQDVQAALAFHRQVFPKGRGAREIE